MNKNKRINWSERSRAEKVLVLAQLIVSVFIFCSAVLKYLNYWSNALDFVIPMFGVYYLLQALYHWKKDRDVAALFLIMTILIFGISCAVFFL